MLLQAGSDTDDIDPSSEASWIVAADHNNFEEAKFLLDAMLMEHAEQHSGKTASMIAYSHGYIDLMKYLLAFGDDMDAQDIHGNTLLLAALQNRDNPIVTYLWNAGASSVILSANGAMTFVQAFTDGAFSAIQCIAKHPEASSRDDLLHDGIDTFHEHTYCISWPTV